MNPQSLTPVNPDRFTDEFMEAVALAYSRETDPYAILAAHVHMFADIPVSKIREMFILSDSFGEIRTPSREYIRQKIVSVRGSIRKAYLELYGENISLSILIPDKNIDECSVVIYGREDLDDEESTGKETTAQIYQEEEISTQPNIDNDFDS